MAYYNYVCLDCKAKAEKIKGSPLTDDEMFEVIFETTHSMAPKPAELHEARECPRCNKHNTERTYLGHTISAVYIRGNGYLDKPGCHRDMNLHKLEVDDPYKEYREVGEVDDLKIRLKKSGQRKTNTKYFSRNKK